MITGVQEAKSQKIIRCNRVSFVPINYSAFRRYTMLFSDCIGVARRSPRVKPCFRYRHHPVLQKREAVLFNLRLLRRRSAYPAETHAPYTRRDDTINMCSCTFSICKLDLISITSPSQRS